ncbi:DUF6892 domain-containing protein [Streptomyces sp. NPDC060085]|uniref:DUF6892 domain-containing protein n=1 Tax=Streptomyces sp. NPDC060085 TaxID=3347054 RepID=UPI003667EF26
MTNIKLIDRNLQLALLDEAYTDRLGDYYWVSLLRKEYDTYQKSAGGPAWDDLLKRLGIDHLPELEEFLLTLPLTPDDLAQMTRLRLDGDREIYTLYPGWWHFGGHFRITSLDGIDHCTALVDLDLNSMVEPCSLSPLATLTSLRYLQVDSLHKYWDLDALESLPALAEIVIVNKFSSEGNAKWSCLLARLKARGISVRYLMD